MGREIRMLGYQRSTAADSYEKGGRQSDRGVTTKHSLLTSSYTADVDTLETAIGRFASDRPLANDCQVAFFEVPGDNQLHVNVTHRHPTIAVRGWAGPARLTDGFVHNRRFDEASPNQMIRHIREMVFAARA